MTLKVAPSTGFETSEIIFYNMVILKDEITADFSLNIIYIMRIGLYKIYLLFV